MNSDGLCVFNQCKHPDADHVNGSCYAITEPDKEGITIFCKCDSQHGINLRLYQDLGYTVEQNADMMVTKKCLKCRDNVLLRRDESLCSKCKPYSQDKLQEIPEFFVFKPLPQEELQKLI